MTERLKKALLGVAALTALALGAGALAQAGGSGANDQGAEERSEDGNRENSANDRDDVQHENEGAEEGENGAGEESGDEDEGEKSDAARGPGADNAKSAARRYVNGTVNAAERDTENGGTWEVEITKANGKTVDVRLDENYKLVVIDDDTEHQDESR